MCDREIILAASHYHSRAPTIAGRLLGLAKIEAKHILEHIANNHTAAKPDGAGAAHDTNKQDYANNHTNDVDAVVDAVTASVQVAQEDPTITGVHFEIGG